MTRPVVGDETRQLRWEIKYLAYPYTSWTLEEYEQADDAQRAFHDLWTATPPALNLSMRSLRLDADD